MKNKINVFDHETVPKHIILTEEEKNEVIEKYGIKKIKQFPKILKTDAATRVLDAKVGDLIKIIRKNETGKESIYYRVVTDG